MMWTADLRANYREFAYSDPSSRDSEVEHKSRFEPKSIWHFDEAENIHCIQMTVRGGERTKKANNPPTR